MIIDAFNTNRIFLKLIGNEDVNKVMILMIKNTTDSLNVYIPEGITTFRNPCSSSTVYSFYSPKRIDINLDQYEKFILINQVGSTLIESGSCLFDDRMCHYFNFGTFFPSYNYDPILDSTLQKLLPFNPDTSTLQQVNGDKNGYLLIQRNYNTTGMNSRYIYLDKANEGEKYTKLTTDWTDSAFDSLTTHDFIIELEDNQKIIRSVEVPEIKITNTGLHGANNSIFTIIIEIDSIAPVLSISTDTLYQPEFIEVSSTEDGIIYLVPEGTNRDLMKIREECIDSVVTIADSNINFPIPNTLGNGVYWLYARDSTGNISEPEAYTIMNVGIDNSIADQIKIYPNPANDMLTIQTKNSGQHTIEITYLNGQLIYHIEMHGNSHQIDLSSFQKGLYFITIRSKDYVMTEKIIKL